MKNLKKTLAVVLAFAMILSMGAVSTFAYTDVAEGTVVSEAVEILSNLGIFTGYEDGTFKPSETVTRAQMAAIICRTLGYEDQAQSSMGSTVFEDVAADHWASGYINVAQAQQIINGYGNGKFGPEDKVTYEQAVKMIVAALGYDLAAQSKGGYPTGYLAIASSKGITKNANGRVGDAAARSAIAVLVYNSLEVELMDQTSWSTGAAGDEYGMTGETILSRYLDVKKYEGTVTETPLTSIAFYNTYDVESEAKVFIDDAKSWGFVSGSYVLSADAFSNAIDATLIADADKFLGKKVIAYVGEDAETGEEKIFAMAEKQGANTTLSFNATQLVDGDVQANKLVYKKAGSNKKLEVKLNLQQTYVNYDVVANPANTDEIVDLFANGGTFELIDSNPATAGYETIIAIAYNYEAVVEEVEVDGEDIFFGLYTGDLDDIDMESETELVVVIKDGAVVEPTAIAAGDVVSTVEIGGTAARVLYVSSKNVTGSVDGWDEEAVTIAGNEYKPSALFPAEIGKTQLETLQNKEGIFYLNVDGQIAYADATASKGGYAFILNTGKDAGMGSKYYATIVEANGEAKAYNYAKNVTINGVSKTSADAHAAIAALMGDVVNADEAYATVDTAYQLLFEVKIKNGEIKDLVAVTFTTPSSTSEYNAETKSLGAKTFDETSVMFALKGAYNATSRIEEEDIKVAKVVEMLADEENYYIALPSTGLENGIYKVAVGYDLVTSISAESELIVVTGKKTISYNDDAATKITGLQGGKEVEILLYNEDGFNSNKQLPGDAEFLASNLAVGDIILTSTVNAEGVADDFMVVYDKSADTTYAAAGWAAKEIYVASANTSATKAADDNYIWFDGSVANVTQGSEVIDSTTYHYLIMQKTANTVLVDYTEDPAEPEISKKSLSKSLIGNPTKYDAKVFVRVVDEVLVDVVVYRTLD